MRASLFFMLAAVAWSGPSSAQPARQSASEDVPSAVAERARAIAEGSAAFREKFADARTIYVGTDLERRKGEGDIEPPPFYRVRHYRYADDSVVTSLVDPASNRLVDQTVIANAPAPLAESELIEARSIALGDNRVRRALGAGFERLIVEPLMVRTSDPTDIWFGQRVVRLLFRAGRNYLSNPIVYVNLTARTVIVEEAHKRVRGDEG